jgi:hydroxymethylglutaryl-CoA lyase
MSTTSYAGAVIRDVTLRDGLQLAGRGMPTSLKLDLVRGLFAAGVPELEIGSMARPDLVPALGDTLDLVGRLTPAELERSWVWVATPGHVRRAGAAGVTRFQYCLSVSDAHNQANIGRRTEDSIAALPDALEHAREVDGAVQLCLATAFTCPFDGAVDPERVLQIVTDPRTAGCTEIVVCDTLGQAVPAEVAALVRAVRAVDPRPVTFHGHDTWGAGVANAIAALDAGARAVDGCLGGLGGCPFAPGAGGNTATEDLVFALRPDWLDPDRFGALVTWGEEVLAAVGEPDRSRARQGARSSRSSFRWAMEEARQA